jgi:hypothetical protein
VTYLIVGLDRTTLAQWHGNVLARDVSSATRIARARAAAQGIALVIAAVIGPNSAVITESAVTEVQDVESAVGAEADVDRARPAVSGQLLQAS